MKHVKKITVSKAQFFENIGGGNPITFGVWAGSIIYFFKNYNDF